LKEKEKMRINGKFKNEEGGKRHPGQKKKKVSPAAAEGKGTFPEADPCAHGKDQTFRKWERKV